MFIRLVDADHIQKARPATWTVGGHKQSQDPTDEAEVVAVDAKRAAAFVVNTLAVVVEQTGRFILQVEGQGGQDP